ncbi:small, acid-soluble spore protein L [Terrilactibacillus sp. BCM23-1]|uniref:Small, acid-soluble spore protein L n=1 Tax=Terrilactibacillus tamarindi TaxID=2599694 RepID=A0A6N8CRA1_9BACI|nr:small, acid-soluble spore protein L [Terrilactibacillus tamarindi]MTT32571.1 small, acid-soluble spore protein L [Terrilactibacillus tamarindi]
MPNKEFRSNKGKVGSSVDPTGHPAGSHERPKTQLEEQAQKKNGRS